MLTIILDCPTVIHFFVGCYRLQSVFGFLKKEKNIYTLKLYLFLSVGTSDLLKWYLTSITALFSVNSFHFKKNGEVKGCDLNEDLVL